MLTAAELSRHLKGCARNSRDSQKIIYAGYYPYAMSVCCRYTSSEEDALEILQDGFLKVFKEVSQFKPAYSDEAASFKGWLRKIMIYTAIDHFRKKSRQPSHLQDPAELPLVDHAADALDKLSYNEIIAIVRRLSPAYRTVFNLFVIEGFTHEEIARELGISAGTSKSNLSKARAHLQKILINEYHIEYSRNAV